MYIHFDTQFQACTNDDPIIKKIVFSRTRNAKCSWYEVSML